MRWAAVHGDAGGLNGITDALISYAGEPWDVIDVFSVAFGQVQRELVMALTDDQLQRLCQMPEEQLLAQRRREENEIAADAEGGRRADGACQPRVGDLD